MTRRAGTRLACTLIALTAPMAACSPKVEVQAPKEPIVINMNVKIEHEIKVKVDKDLDNMFAEHEDLF